jgi:hypothetical protein
MRVFQNRVLKRTFEAKRDEVKGGWKKNCIPRSCVICTLRQVTSMRMRWAGHVS